MKEGEKRKTFDKLYKKNSRLVINTIAKYGVPVDEREDISQEVWLRFWKNIDRIDFDLSVEAYLHQVAKHLCFDRVRSKRYRQGLETASLNFKTAEEAELSEVIEGADWEGEMEAKDQREAVLKEIKEILPRFQHEPILLNYGGIDYVKISVLLKEHLGTVKSRIFRGRDTFKVVSKTYKELCGLR